MRDAGRRLLEKALQFSAPEVELYEKKAETKVWHYSPATGFLDGHRSVRGLALRLFKDGGVRFFAAPEGDSIWETHLPPPAKPPKGSAVLRAPAPSGSTSHPAPPVPLPEPVLDRRPMLRSIEREIIRLSSGSVRLLSAELQEGVHRAHLTNSRGIDVSSASYGFHLVLRVTGEHDGRRLSAIQIEGGREFPPPSTIAGRAVDRILYPLRGRDLPDRKGEILADPLVATAILAGLSDAFVAGRRPVGWPTASVIRDGRWGSTALSIVDDGRFPEGPNPQNHDGEGLPQHRRVVLREGTIGELLCDSAEAARFATSPTGNAVRDSYREPPRAGITQCYIEPSLIPPSDLLGEIRSGYYLLSTAGRGEFDLANDRFSLPVNGVYLQKGRARHPIRPALLAGKISDLVRGVRAVASDLGFHPREGWFGSPTLLLVGMRLS